MRMIFFFIVLSIFLLLNAYLLTRGVQALSLAGISKWVFVTAFVALSLSFMLGMMLENKLPIGAIKVLQLTGGTWLFAMMYFAMAAMLFDMVRVANHYLHFYPTFVVEHYTLSKQLAVGVSALIIGMALAVGNFKFNRPVVEQRTITINKAIAPEGLRVVAAADVHLGYTIDKKRLQGFVEMINAQKPDIVLIAGDLIDRSLRPVLEAHMEEDLLKIKAPLGVYAVFGNHEYYGDLSGDLDFYKRAGITLLRDSVAMPSGKLYVVGRDDRTNHQRKSLAELTVGLDQSLPIIVLDHQPFNLEHAEAANIDLQLSGHVHNGQVWPINLITSSIYELPYGHKQKGNTHVYVTSGLGIWGPHLRIGTQSELVNILVKGK